MTGARDRVELIATVLLAVATVATAWSGGAVFVLTAVWIAYSPISLTV